MTYEPDFAVFEREVHRRASLGDSARYLSEEYSLPSYVVKMANARGDSSLLVEASADGAYLHRLYALARRRPGLFFAAGFAPDAPIEFADTETATPADTDDIDDPFGPQDSNGGFLGGTA